MLPYLFIYLEWDQESTFCCSIKSGWIHGDGFSIKFRVNDWLGTYLIQTLNIPEEEYHLLPENLYHYLINYTWCLPDNLIDKYPELSDFLSHAILPTSPNNDKYPNFVGFW